MSNPKFNRTNENVDWAWWTWNPVTGCKNNCPYCYARDIANRFYKEGFEPTFRPERLSAPQNTKVPPEAETDVAARSVFTVSMGDLFGPWVPQEWIDAVLEAVRKAPQWNFIFLTKFPKRLVEIDWPENAWVGTTVDVQARVALAEETLSQVEAPVRWLSCEPLEEELTFSDLSWCDLVVIGGRSKSTKMPAGQPKWEWVESLVSQARRAGSKVFFKANLKSPPGVKRPRELPEQQGGQPTLFDLILEGNK